MSATRWLLPLLALPSALVWLVVSVVRLVSAATVYHQRVVAPAPGLPLPTAAQVQRMLAAQNHWGIHAMWAVAAVALSLVLTLVAWLRGGRPIDRR